MEEAESRYGREQPHRSASSSRWFPIRAVSWRPPLFPRGPLPVHRAGALRAVLPPLSRQPPPQPRQPGTLPLVIVGPPWRWRVQGRQGQREQLRTIQLVTRNQSILQAVRT